MAQYVQGRVTDLYQMNWNFASLAKENGMQDQQEWYTRMNHGIYYKSCNDGTDTQYLKLTGKQDMVIHKRNIN